jgi:hypothetical protein
MNFAEITSLYGAGLLVTRDFPFHALFVLWSSMP